MAISYKAQPILSNGLSLFYDFANERSYSPNVFKYPLDPFRWVEEQFAAGGLGTTYGNQSTITRDNTIAASPAKGLALKMACNGNTDPHTLTYSYAVWNIAPALSGEQWTVSGWIRASTSTTAGFYLFGANASGGFIELSLTTVSVTTSWQRFSGTITL